MKTSWSRPVIFTVCTLSAGSSFLIYFLIVKKSEIDCVSAVAEVTITLKSFRSVKILLRKLKSTS
jgi:hypothetical protein